MLHEKLKIFKVKAGKHPLFVKSSVDLTRVWISVCSYGRIAEAVTKADPIEDASETWTVYKEDENEITRTKKAVLTKASKGNKFIKEGVIKYFYNRDQTWTFRSLAM